MSRSSNLLRDGVLVLIVLGALANAAWPASDSTAYVYANPERRSIMRKYAVIAARDTTVGNLTLSYFRLRHDIESLQRLLDSKSMDYEIGVFWLNLAGPKQDRSVIYRQVGEEAWREIRLGTADYYILADATSAFAKKVALGFPSDDPAITSAEPLALECAIGYYVTTQGAVTRASSTRTGMGASITPDQIFRFRLDAFPPSIESLHVNRVDGTGCAVGWSSTSKIFYAPYDGDSCVVSIAVFDSVAEAIDKVAIQDWIGREYLPETPGKGFWACPPDSPVVIQVTIPGLDSLQEGVYPYVIVTRDTAFAAEPLWDPEKGEWIFARGGNWSDTAAFAIVIDRTPAPVDLATPRDSVLLFLRDPDTGSPAATDNANLVKISLKLGESLRWEPQDWAVRGMWKVAFAEGRRDTSFFACGSFDWDSLGIALPDSFFYGNSFSWTVPLHRPYEPGDSIYVTCAILDSSGIVSNKMVAGIRYVGPLHFQCTLADPVAEKCQIDTLWSNDQDLLLVRVDTTGTDQIRVRRIVVTYGWTDDRWVKDFNNALPDSFRVPVLGSPVQCREDGSWVRIEAIDVVTAAHDSDTQWIGFDYASPAVGDSFLYVRGTPLRPDVDCPPLPGWTATPVVLMASDERGYQDNCNGIPARIRVEGDIGRVIDTCAAGVAGTAANVIPGLGQKAVRLRAMDPAGNWSSTVEQTVILDSLPVDTSLVEFWLADPVTGRDVRTSSDTVMACLKLKDGVSCTDELWELRGVWKIGFRGQPSGSLDFASSSFDWDNAEILEFDSMCRHDTLRWRIPARGAEDGYIVVSACFLDSSGVISEVVMDSIRYVPPPRLAFTLADPTPQECQVDTIWSNDTDSLLVRIDPDRTDQDRIGRIVVSYGWTDSVWTSDFERGLPSSFRIPLLGEPNGCGGGKSWVQIEGIDLATAASSKTVDSIRFDFEVPALSDSFLYVVGSALRSNIDCQPLPGWTATPRIVMTTDASGYYDGCGGVPIRIEITGDLESEIDTCAASFVSASRSVSSGPGPKTFRVAAMDSAGNWSDVLRPSIVLDPLPLDTSFINLSLANPGTDDAVTVWFNKREGVACSDWGLRGIWKVGLLPGKRDLSAFACSAFDWASTSSVSLDSLCSGFRIQRKVKGELSETGWIYISACFLDSSGTISEVLVDSIQARPLVSIAVQDYADPGDSTFVGDSVRIVVRWDRLALRPGESGLLQIEHWPGAPHCAFSTLLDTTVTEPAGNIVRVFSICSQQDTTTIDKFVAKLQAPLELVADTSIVVVDQMKPSVQLFCIVASDQSKDCITSTRDGRVWAYLAVHDQMPGKLKRAYVKYWHKLVSTGTDSTEVEVTECDVASYTGWIPIDLGANYTGWWAFQAVVEDCREQISLSDIVAVDYNPEEKEAFCYPNPFRPSEDGVVCFRVYTTEAGPAEVSIYDGFGFLVNQWETARLRVGANDGCDPVEGLTWDGRNGSGELVASGGYICRIRTKDGKVHTIKVGVLR